MLNVTPETLGNYANCKETDEDQCWYAVTDTSDGSVSCPNCPQYYLNSDSTLCISCATAEDTDGAGTMACGTGCTNWTLDGSDTTICNYDDCTITEQDDNGDYYCVCDGYTYDSANDVCANWATTIETSKPWQQSLQRGTPPSAPYLRVATRGWKLPFDARCPWSSDTRCAIIDVTSESRLYQILQRLLGGPLVLWADRLIKEYYFIWNLTTSI